MAGRIRDEDLKLVRERSAIDEVVGEYLQLKSAGGGSLKGLCPFHEEKTPSFNVTPSRGLFYCFSCSEGGDVISFVQKIDHVSFAEAVEQLAARAGIQLRYEQGGYVPRQDRGLRARLIEAYQTAAEFYAEQLTTPAAEAGRRFLAERGFERADWERFGVGFAPDAWEALVGHLRGRKFTDAEITKGGLVGQGRRGPIDRFRGRLIWPIRNLTGEVIAFGARKLDERDDGPKYLNTPETPIFHKGSVLYGADMAKREIAKRRKAVIVEGYTDVMACHLAGVPFAVATCGTSFGEEHVKILRRFLMDSEGSAGEVIFTFDGDVAGQRAALRTFDLDYKFASQTYVAVQPDGLDPCELRMKHGDDAVVELVESRDYLFDFAIRARLAQHDLEHIEGRFAALEAVGPIIASIRNEGVRKKRIESIDRQIGIMDERLVAQTIGKYLPGRGNKGKRAERQPERQRPQQPVIDPNDPVIQVEHEALKLAVQRPTLLGPAFDALGSDVFRLPDHAELREVISACGGVESAGDDWVTRLRESARSDDVRELITQYAVESIHFHDEPDDRYAEIQVARLREFLAERQINAIKPRLERTNPIKEAEQHSRLFAELVAWEKERQAARQRAIEA